MTTRVEDGVVQVLRTALKKIDEEAATLDRLAEEKRREFEEYVARQRESLDRRREALGNALQAMATDIVEGPVPTAVTDEHGARLAISDGNLDMIREYIAANNGAVRQQDVVSDTGLNSGVVSVGLRRLMALGEIERSGKDRGSQLWLARQPILAGAESIVSIKPGIGVAEANRI